MDTTNVRSTSPTQEALRNDIQKVLTSLYNASNHTPVKKFLTQAELAKELHISQSAISRALKGYEIDWENCEIKKKATTNELVELTKGITVSVPSTFFVSVPSNRRKKLKEALLLHFPSNRTQYGIIHIIETPQPSGLLIFSDDHNLWRNITDKDYLQETMDNINSRP